MKERLKNAARKTKDFAMMHRGKIVFVSTSLMWVYATNKSSQELTAFLESKGIDPDEYFLSQEDYEELKNS